MPKPERLLFRRAAGRIWIGMKAQRRAPGYPLLLDIFDVDPAFIAESRARTRFMLAASLLAPRFEQLETSTRRARPLRIGFDETAEQESLFEQQRTLALAAEALAALGVGYGLILPAPNRLDSVTRQFVEMLAERIGKYDFAILTGRAGGAATSELPSRPFDRRWLQQPPVVRFLGAVGDAVRLDGWNYLRAHRTMMREHDRRVVTHHRAFAAGFQAIGRDFLFAHYRHLAARRDIRLGQPRQSALAALAAARLAPRVAIRDGSTLAAALFARAARSGQLLPVERADLLQQFANLRAVLGGEAGRVHAGGLYDRAEGLLAGAPRSRRATQLAIRILNGRALIAYRRGLIDEAERLEREALTQADRVAHRWPGLRDWAHTLVYGNLATLALNGQDRLDLSIGYSAQARAARRDAGHDDHLETARLAGLLARAGRLAESQALLAPLAATCERDWSEAAPYVILLNAALLARLERPAAALSSLDRAGAMLDVLGSASAREMRTRIHAELALAG